MTGVSEKLPQWALDKAAQTARYKDWEDWLRSGALALWWAPRWIGLSPALAEKIAAYDTPPAAPAPETDPPQWALDKAARYAGFKAYLQSVIGPNRANHA